MEDENMSRDQLKSELMAMRQRVIELEQSESESASLIETLQKDTEWYRDMVDKANDIIQSVTPDGRFIYVNKTWQDMLGYGEDEIPDLTIWDIIHLDHIAHCQDVFSKIMSGEEVQSVETVFVAKGGRPVIVEGNVNCQFEEEKPVYTRGIFRDVTRHRQAEVRIQHSEEYFRSLIENSYDVIVVEDADGTIRYTSRSIERVLGYKPDELVGKKFFELIHPDELQNIVSIFAEAVQVPGHIGSMVVRLQHKDGSWRIVEGTGTNLLANPSVEGIVTNFHDITDRKQIEEALYLSKEHYYSLIENTFDTLMVMNTDGSIGYINRSIKKLLGYDPSEWIGEKIVDYIHPDDMPKFIENLNVAFRSPGLAGFMELRLRHKDGSWRIIEGTGVNLLDNASVKGIVVSLRDITDREQIKRALMESQVMYKSMVETADKAGEGIIIAQNTGNVEGAVVFANDEVLRITGYSRDEFIGSTVQNLLPADNLSELMDRYKRRQAGEDLPGYQELWLNRKDGKTVPVDVCAAVMTYQGKVATMAFIRDISERKQIEEALYLSKDHYHALIQNAFETIIVMEADGSISYISPSIKQMLGYEPAEWIGRKVFDFIHQEELPKLVDNFNEGVQTPGHVGSMELRLQHKDGSWRKVEGVGTNLLANPSVSGLVVNFRDVSERNE